MKSSESLSKYFLAAFVLWIYCFRGFITGELALVSDAVSYYDHVKYFVENLSQGVYPMWDHVWNKGSANEFFLRRMGSYNPIYLLLTLLYKCSIPYITAYTLTMSFYYFIGCFGFFKVAEIVIKSRRFAFVAFLLLYFSTFATRVFDSFIVLPFVPMIWFFYFFLCLLKKPSGYSLLGLIYCLMLMLTTYIPFYFLSILILFILSLFVVYANKITSTVIRLWQFIKSEKVRVLLAVVLLSISMVPGFLMFKAAKAGDFAMTTRSAQAESSNVIAVGAKTVKTWGMLEDIVYSSAFVDLKDFKFAIIFVSVFVYLLLVLGLFNRINRLSLFLFVFALLTSLVFSSHLPFYQWLYDHVFFFKYFRNLHFYLWWVLLPVMILFAVEQLRSFLENIKDHKKLKVILVILVHLSGFVYMFYRGDLAITSWATVLLSLAFFILFLFDRLPKKEEIVLVVLGIIVVIQPVQAYHYLDKNAKPWHRTGFYDRPYLEFSYQRGTPDWGVVEDRFVKDQQGNIKYLSKQGWGIHYSSAGYAQLDENVNFYILRKYVRNKFYVYDRVAGIENGKLDYKALAKAMYHDTNVAYTDMYNIDPDIEEIDKPAARAQIIKSDSDEFQVLNFSANHIKFRTNFKDVKYLVYTDSAHPKWREKGTRWPVNIANGAFKGAWIFPGERIIEWRFGSTFEHLAHWLMVILYMVILGRLFYGWLNEFYPTEMEIDD